MLGFITKGLSPADCHLLRHLSGRRRHCCPGIRSPSKRRCRRNKPLVSPEYPAHAATSYLAIEFGISGPAISISSNCCTGIDAIYSGYSAIANGNATTAIVGASDAPIFPLSFGALCALGALTRRNSEPTKASRPYDALRDGIVIAEGAATLVLEDLEVAQDRGATIYAEILGHGAASEAIGMRKGDPSGHVMANAIAIGDPKRASSPLRHRPRKCAWQFPSRL